MEPSTLLIVLLTVSVDTPHGQIYNLHGEAITQCQLADYINDAFGTALIDP